MILKDLIAQNPPQKLAPESVQAYQKVFLDYYQTL